MRFAAKNGAETAALESFLQGFDAMMADCMGNCFRWEIADDGRWGTGLLRRYKNRSTWFVVLAKAGTHAEYPCQLSMDSRVRGNDEVATSDA
jgi:hypothetical protein